MRRQTRWAMLVALLVSVLMVGTTAAAGKQDSFVGSGRGFYADNTIRLVLSAHSGPSGENPQGQVHFTGLFGLSGKADVTCLNVAGNKASLVARVQNPASVRPGTDAIDIFVYAADNGAPGQSPDDGIDFGYATYSGYTPDPITSCQNFGGSIPATQGNFVIKDATP